MLPDRAEEILSVSKSLVVLDEVKERSTDDCEVEDLMARSTVVKSSWLASLWTPDHIKDRSLDIDVASECVAPAPIRCYVFLHKLKHDEHHPTRQAQDNVHYATCLLKLWLVKLRNQRYCETCDAGDHLNRAVNPLCS